PLDETLNNSREVDCHSYCREEAFPAFGRFMVIRFCAPELIGQRRGRHGQKAQPHSARRTAKESRRAPSSHLGEPWGWASQGGGRSAWGADAVFVASSFEPARKAHELNEGAKRHDLERKEDEVPGPARACLVPAAQSRGKRLRYPMI